MQLLILNHPTSAPIVSMDFWSTSVPSKAEMVDVNELFDWSVYGQVATYHCSKHFKIPWLRKTTPRFEVRKDFSGLFSKTLKKMTPTNTGWWFEPLISQLGLLFPIHGKKKNPNHQPEIHVLLLQCNTCHDYKRRCSNHHLGGLCVAISPCKLLDTPYCFFCVCK